MAAFVFSVVLLLIVAPGLILGVGYAGRSIAGRRRRAPADPAALALAPMKRAP